MSQILTPESHYDQIQIIAAPGQPMQVNAVRVYPISPNGQPADPPVFEPLPLSYAIAYLMEFCKSQAVSLATERESRPKLEVASN